MNNNEKFMSIKDDIKLIENIEDSDPTEEVKNNDEKKKRFSIIADKKSCEVQKSEEPLKKKVLNDSSIISDEKVREAIELILTKIVYVLTYDVPYGAGYSKDGKMIYIDRGIPGEFKKSIVIHETIEKTLEDRYNMPYTLAHQLAMIFEKQYVSEEKWNEYNEMLQPYLTKAYSKEMTNLPPDLDLTPYVDMKDYETIKEIYDVKTESDNKKFSIKGLQ